MTGAATIRPARASDAEAVVRMAEEFEDYLNALDDDPAEATPPPLTTENYRRDGFGREPRFHGLIAELDGAPVGYLLYYLGYWAEDAATCLHVADLFVREAARGRGIGGALMAEAAAILRRHDGRRVLWTVWSRNRAAIGFYQGLGAHFFDEEPLMTWPRENWSS